MGVFRGPTGDVELDDIELTGPRLTLRRWQPDDAPRVAQVMTDPSMAQYLAVPQPYTAADARAFVTEIGHEGRVQGTGIGSAVVESGSDRIVGSCALRLTGDPEIGYWVAPDARGRGYAAEVTRLLADLAFRFGLRRVHLAVDVRNVASAATALAAGFRFEGVARSAVTSPGGGKVAPYIGELARFGRTAEDPGDPVPPAFARLPGDRVDDGVLALRPLRPTDGPALAETEDAETVRWGFTGHPEPREQTLDVARRAGLDWLVGGAARLAMEDVATGAFAGSISMRRSGPPQVGGIGYVVHPAWRGRGYTTRALRLLVDWAFAHAGIARLELGAKTGNVASQRAAANAGFEPDGVRRGRLRNADGTFDDEVRFCLLRP